ncbi:hypothetical protein JJB98_04085 [Bradyrhizobium diazoefficiens]|nr:hypothetical protein [Bradyrhizobium diazoefficiens]QQO19142.1 hypothetical protein JJB98_04085 [Bradyrhizobium diazoefficiens]
MFFKFLLLIIIGIATLFILADISSEGARLAKTSPLAASELARQTAPVLSPGEEYTEVMLAFQYHYLKAFRAGICHVRSEAYFPAFETARERLQIETAQRLRLSPQQVDFALAEVNRRFAKDQEGVPEFNLVDGCAYLRTSPSMNQLDNLYRQITANYH